MLGAQLGDGSDHIRARVLRQRARDDLERLPDRLEWPLVHALYVGRLSGERLGDAHLGSAAAGEKLGLEHDVADNLHRVLEITLDLIQDVLGPSTEHDGARLGVLALLQEGEVLVSNLAHLEETTTRAEIGLAHLLWTVHNGGANRPGDAVVVRLAQAAESCDACLREVMLGQVRDAFLRHDDVRPEGDDVGAQVLDVLLLHPQHAFEVLFIRDLHVRLRLALLVLERAVEEEDPRILDAAPHLRVRRDLVEHDAVQDGTVGDLATRNLLYFGVALDVHFRPVSAVGHDAADRVDGEADDDVAEAGAERGAHRRLDQLLDGGRVLNVHMLRDLLAGVQRNLQRAGVALDHERWMDVPLQEGLGHGQHLPSKDDYRGGAVADFFILLGTEEWR
eukprot:scaffold1469_cov257-Pinguiococcus_pyrenoidosus.AAC.4